MNATNMSEHSAVKNSITKFFSALKDMIAYECVINNIIGLMLGLLALAILEHPSFLPKLGVWYKYLTYFIEALLVYQCIKSAIKSLLIPLMVVLIAGMGFAAIQFNFDWTWLNVLWLQKIMLVGIIGVATSGYAIAFFDRCTEK